MSDSNILIEPFRVLSQVVQIFDALKVDYFVTGSVASSIRGEFRGTNDIDIVAALSLDHSREFSRLASKYFFVDEMSVVEAVRDQRSFNIIHQETIIKVDIFTGLDLLNKEQLKRAEALSLTGLDIKTKIATAEDIIISKLIWYRKGGELSERQWRDILGVLDASREFLDLAYIESWANKLGFKDLLEKALLNSN